MKRLLLSIAIIAVLSLPKIKGQVFTNSPDRPARLPKVTQMDTSYMECVYQHSIYDPILDETKTDYKILQIGNNISKYSDYDQYRLDSIIAVDYSGGISRNQYYKLAHPFSTSPDAIFRNKKLDKLTVYDKVFMDLYFYEDSLSHLKWTLHNATANICGHRCRKASTAFRGRNWTAWYCPEIAINNGPWKFGNLPGIILKVESDDNQHKIEVTTIRKNTIPIGLKQKLFQKTTRLKFNQELEDYCTRPSVYFGGSHPFPAKDSNGNEVFNPHRRLFFNPIELE